ncbi:hypothetical protein [Bradyrhizobium prioriisuperbiae]|uniref:hypothetical protein n=1 Tax=Bradyrhizobium prioriisuperbiae TaxID=2854389 RepID=UPI0028F0D95B|nr:hypothetical protein [Bradyrhizobium prioritasuperba]
MAPPRSIRSACATERNPTPRLDLDLADPAAKSAHAQSLTGALRYVDHEVFGDCAGILVEEASTNGIEDAGYSSDTALPNGWRVLPQPVTTAECTMTFTRRGAGQGLLRLTGQATRDLYLVLGSPKHFAIAAGENLTGSLAIRLAGGSMANVAGLGLLNVENDSAGVPAVASLRVAPIQQLQADKAWWAQVRSVAGHNSHANLALKISVAGAYDVSFEINSPQLEKRTWRSSYGVSARPADDITLSPAHAAYLAQPERSVVITADAPRVAGTASLWSEWKDDRNFVELQLRNHALFVRVVANGVPTEAQLGIVPPLARLTAAIAMGATSVLGSVNGKAPKWIDVAPPAGMTTARLGRGSTGYWNATIKRLSLYASAIDCAEASLREQVFFDDFDRLDSRWLGWSPTGQSIAKVGNVDTAIAAGKWVARSGGLGLAFAGYGKVTLPAVPRYMGAVLNWTTGRSGGAAGLIAATNDLSDPADALHTVLTDTTEIFQTITASRVDDALTTFTYPNAMRRDGATPYGVARLFNRAENAVVFVGPDGDLPRHVSATYGERIGKTAVFEHYWQLGQCRPEFLAVAAA